MPLLLDLTHNWREYAETLVLSLLTGLLVSPLFLLGISLL